MVQKLRLAFALFRQDHTGEALDADFRTGIAGFSLVLP